MHKIQICCNRADGGGKEVNSRSGWQAHNEIGT